MTRQTVFWLLLLTGCGSDNAPVVGAVGQDASMDSAHGQDRLPDGVVQGFFDDTGQLVLLLDDGGTALAPEGTDAEMFGALDGGGAVPVPALDAGMMDQQDAQTPEDAGMPDAEVPAPTEPSFTECYEQAECGAQACTKANFCAPICTASGDCDALGTHGRCAPDQTCFIDCGDPPFGTGGQCPDPLICVANRCEIEYSCERDPQCAPCTTDGDCPGDFGCCRFNGTCGTGAGGSCF